MLYFCFQFAATSDLLFNPNKSYCIKLCKYISVALYMLELQGCHLSWYDKIVLLGHVCMIYNKDLLTCVHKLTTLLVSGHLSHIYINKYCFLLNRLQLWKLYHSALCDYEIALCESIRHIWRLPYRTHSSLLSAFANDLELRVILFSRLIKFASQYLYSDNICESFIVKI